MRARLFILFALAAIVAGAAALRWGWERESSASCRLDRVATIPVDPCVTPFPEDGLQRWWRVSRDRALDYPAVRASLGPLEACNRFIASGSGPTGGGICSDEMLKGLDLRRVDWWDRTFVHVGFGGSGRINHANLGRAVFRDSDLSGLSFATSVFYRATFSGGSLRNATFQDSDLRDVMFDSVDVTDTIFRNSNLNGAYWEPRPRTLPDVASMAYALNLHGLVYRDSPQQLLELRDALYKAGLAEQARQVTFAIERTGRVRDTKDDSLLKRAAGWFRFIAFEKTVGYGMYPFRPLLLIALLIPLFTPLYLAAVWWRGGRLWLRRSDGAIGQDAPAGWRPVALMVHGPWDARLAKSLGHALWFSIICAFRIGYRDVNVGDWITRLQPGEYLLGATGWCRTVAGVQSLLSVYLLALTVLCIIGRPFG